MLYSLDGRSHAERTDESLSMLTIHIIRHGETDWNRARRFQGQTDVPLNQTGMMQARLVADVLRNEPLQAVVSSDLVRALDTAQVIAERHGLQVQKDTGLREMSFGEWEGLSHDDLRSGKWADLFSRYRKDSLAHRPPGAEHPDEALQRVRQSLQRILTHRVEGTVVLVAHGGSCRLLICAAIGAPADCARHIRLDNASISTLECRDGFCWLTRLNRTEHLESMQLEAPVF